MPLPSQLALGSPHICGWLLQVFGSISIQKHRNDLLDNLRLFELLLPSSLGLFVIALSADPANLTFGCTAKWSTLLAFWSCLLGGCATLLMKSRVQEGEPDVEQADSAHLLRINQRPLVGYILLIRARSIITLVFLAIGSISMLFNRPREHQT